MINKAIQFLMGIIFFLLSIMTHATELQKIKVLLDWFPNPDHAPLFVAQQQGFFKQQGLDVEFIGPADPTDPPKLVAAGKADIAITYEPQFMEQLDHGLPLSLLGVLIDKPLNCLIVLETSSIHSIKDLKGKKIGHSFSSMNSVMLKTMLEKNNLKMNDIQHINVHYNLSQALLSGNVDAVTGMNRNFELLQMTMVGKSVRAFYPEDNGIPSYSELILVVPKDKKSDPKYQSFLKALQQGIIFLKQNPSKSWENFKKVHPELNNSLNKKAWFATLPYFADNPSKINKTAWINFVAFMKNNNLISDQFKLDLK